MKISKELKQHLEILVYDPSTPAYMNFLGKILLFDHLSDAFDLIRGAKITKKKYNSYLESFKTKFPNEIEITHYLESVYQDYEIRYGKQNNLQNSKIGERKCLIDEILVSGYTIEEYCANLGISISKTYILFKSSACYEEALKEVNKRSNENFFNLLKMLIYRVLYEDMDIVDYYLQTNLDLNDFLRLSRSIVREQSDIIKISEFVRKNQMILKQNIFVKEKELEKNIIINGREVLLEEKEKVFSFLEQNNIPFNIYYVALKKYISGNLNLDIRTVKIKG